MTGVDIALDRVVRQFQLGQEETIDAVNDVTLVIPAGTAVALTGPSGSGKSTLLHLIGALDAADSGRIVVGDQELTAMRERDLSRYRRGVGFVFQRYNLLPALTLLDNVIAPVLPYRTHFDKVSRARELLAAVGLGDREKSLPSRLSGGQQQRVAIARALIGQPRLLLADEPTGNLDSRTGGDIIRLLLGLKSDRGMTIVVATHDPVVASRCDRVIRLRDGRITDDNAVDADTEGPALLERVRGQIPN